MEGDHRQDGLLAKLTEHVPVVPDLPGVKDALCRLDARPLDRKAVGVLIHLAEKREVFAVSVVVVASDL